MSDGKKEQILSDDPASKSNSAAVQEIRGFLRKNLVTNASENSSLTVELEPAVFNDEFLNSIEVALSVRQQSQDSTEEGLRSKAIGITLLNKHCFIADLKPLKGEPHLLRRSHELKLEILQEVLGWQLLVIDEQEYMDLFNQGKQKKEEREAYIMDRIQFDFDVGEVLPSEELD